MVLRTAQSRAPLSGPAAPWTAAPPVRTPPQCGTSPAEASSGNAQRRRPNHGDDRQANSALHTIVLSRLPWDPRTRDYTHRRTAQGKSRCEAIRCLKRCVAQDLYKRMLYKHILGSMPQPTGDALPAAT
ncbi:transposase [Streptomyces sp. NBC_01217]|uniref:transposase n=1 Tax=Streptomyces sp. NBC_01217 TaxID=2903779 RepID=UPI002E12149E|nr:transposase [Streptomyces sp. NBC_01217]